MDVQSAVVPLEAEYEELMKELKKEGLSDTKELAIRALITANTQLITADTTAFAPLYASAFPTTGVMFIFDGFHSLHDAYCFRVRCYYCRRSIRTVLCILAITSSI